MDSYHPNSRNVRWYDTIFIIPQFISFICVEKPVTNSYILGAFLLVLQLIVAKYMVSKFDVNNAIRKFTWLISWHIRNMLVLDNYILSIVSSVFTLSVLIIPDFFFVPLFVSNAIFYMNTTNNNIDFSIMVIFMTMYEISTGIAIQACEHSRHYTRRLFGQLYYATMLPIQFVIERQFVGIDDNVNLGMFGTNTFIFVVITILYAIIIGHDTVTLIKSFLDYVILGVMFVVPLLIILMVIDESKFEFFHMLLFKCITCTIMCVIYIIYNFTNNKQTKQNERNKGAPVSAGLLAAYKKK